MAVSSTSDPLDTTGTSASTLSTWVAPYVTDMLGKAQTLAGQDYTPYDGARVADFSGLQNTAFARYGTMGTPRQFDMATQYSQDLMGKLNGLTPRSFTDQGIAGLYMSPYQQQVIDINKREAQRQADMMGQRDAASAVGKGAFGGYRHGLVEAENNRNLQQRMADIQDKGMQDAFSQAQKQFNVEDALRINSGLQGVNAGYGIAGLLNNLGMNQGTLGLSQLRDMLAAGNTQQNTMQRGLDADYNDFLTQQKWPYQQLDYMRSMLQGLPLSTTNTATNYAPPSTTSQIVGGITTGAGAAGAAADAYKAWGSTPGGTPVTNGSPTVGSGMVGPQYDYSQWSQERT